MSKQIKVNKQMKSRASRFLDLTENVSLGNDLENEAGENSGDNNPPALATEYSQISPPVSNIPIPPVMQESEANNKLPKKNDEEALIEPAHTRGRKPRNKVEEFHFSVENTRTFAQGGGPNNIWLDPKTRSRIEAIEEALGAHGDKKSTLRLAVAVSVNFLWDNHSEEILRLRDAARVKKNQNLE